MRKIVNLVIPKNGIIRLMIYDTGNETYLFGYKKIEDCGSEFDEWYESENEALESCKTEYGINITEWKKIENPELNFQHDWINPVRVKGLENGNPEFEKLEQLVNRKWIEINLTE